MELRSYHLLRKAKRKAKETTRPTIRLLKKRLGMKKAPNVCLRLLKLLILKGHLFRQMNGMIHLNLILFRQMDGMVHPYPLCERLVSRLFRQECWKEDARLFSHPSLRVEQPTLAPPREGDQQDPFVPEPLPLNAAPDSREGLPVFDNVSESVLTVLGFGSDQPKFTEEDVKMEREALTDEEKAAALSDTFGKMCTVSSHKDKRARRDIDTNTVSFLLLQMRLEIEQIPTHEKQALLYAQSKCQEEFADARLSVFLRSEGMNVKAS